jgi:hypothetical protein
MKTFTVIVFWHGDGNASDEGETFAVRISGVADAQEAADNACLHIIDTNGGVANAGMVINGTPKLTIPNEGQFDAQDYDDITHGGDITEVITL